jgi:hypothetical protein
MGLENSREIRRSWSGFVGRLPPVATPSPLHAQQVGGVQANVLAFEVHEVVRQPAGIIEVGPAMRKVNRVGDRKCLPVVAAWQIISATNA